MNTPLQIRRAANTPWPGDQQRVAARGTTFAEYDARQADKADADARRDVAAGGYWDYEGVVWVSHPLDTPEVDLFDPDVDDPLDPRDFELNDD